MHKQSSTKHSCKGARGVVSVQLVVRNEAHRIRECLRAVRAQTYFGICTHVFDNASEDETGDIIRQEFPWAHYIRHPVNVGFGGGQNRLINVTDGEFVIALSADVILERNFCSEAVRCLERDSGTGALQGKSYRGRDIRSVGPKHIDTTGFKIFRSRRLINRGHGEIDSGQFNKAEEIFSFEGAAGFFRRQALEDAKIDGYVYDEDLFWYATDIDLGWRLRMLGWKSFYCPNAVMYHDRPTTERLSGGYADFIRIRRKIPLRKRQLEYRNFRLVLLKYDFIRNILRDIIPIFAREIQFFFYLLLFEPRTLFVIPSLIKLIPLMIRRRRVIMGRKKTDYRSIRKWFS